MIAHWDEIESGRTGAGHYPRSHTIDFRGLGPIARLEDLAYDDGEPR